MAVNSSEAAGAAGSSISMPAIDGVHWKCVTPCFSINAGIESPVAASPPAAGAADAERSSQRRLSSCRCGRLSMTRAVGTPKSTKQAISSILMPRRRSTIATQLSGVPNRPLCW